MLQWTVAIAVLCAVWPTILHAESMPADFVYLRDVDPSIAQDMRYATPNNFTGRTVPGYDASECVLVRQAAEALRVAQRALRAKGLSLKVYDCYRPAQAVGRFVAWAKQPDDPATKTAYYPRLAKSDLFPDYIATRSGHSRGGTVDVTLIPLGEPQPPAPDASACTATSDTVANDGSLPMGTRFDCFDIKANTAAAGLSVQERANRAILVQAMEDAGFTNYPMEWWHFTLKNEPFPEKIFDFPITSRTPDE